MPLLSSFSDSMRRSIGVALGVERAQLFVGRRGLRGASTRWPAPTPTGRPCAWRPGSRLPSLSPLSSSMACSVGNSPSRWYEAATDFLAWSNASRIETLPSRSLSADFAWRTPRRTGRRTASRTSRRPMRVAATMTRPGPDRASTNGPLALAVFGEHHALRLHLRSSGAKSCGVMSGPGQVELRDLVRQTCRGRRARSRRCPARPPSPRRRPAPSSTPSFVAAASASRRHVLLRHAQLLRRRLGQRRAPLLEQLPMLRIAREPDDDDAGACRLRERGAAAGEHTSTDEHAPSTGPRAPRTSQPRITPASSSAAGPIRCR